MPSGFPPPQPSQPLFTMPKQRVRSTRIRKKSHAQGRFFLYPHYAATTLKIDTEIPVSRLDKQHKKNSLAINTGSGHVASCIAVLPYLDLEPVFTIPGSVIHDCLVFIGKHRLLVSGHYHPMAPINGALRAVAPGFNWRGELSVVPLGSRVSYLATTNGTVARLAANK
ncbi:hypothetical protein C8R43DRAFT_1047808 [Mycena crocata]|nr:hypothetical protein C8R43DRAFT_1052309 [Mycena crocata]KAJ7099884.1 hypothetical protein C8R43DRAFT_1048478 [Mycena crocata]KAJ7101583.1 hypothetical protein C8R43DRAFT_1047808 [Mycena crocata]